MKKNIIIKALAGIMVAGMFASCADDYLDLAPEVDYPTSTVTGNTEAAKYAINGLCLSMNTIYDIGLQPYCSGEAWMGTFYGDLFSPDWFYYIFSLSGVDFMKWDFFNKADYMPAFPAWMYGYNLINQANMILEGIDKAEGPEADRQFIKAQALTFRAHAYQMLLRIYGPRWEDSDNGRKITLVWRVKSSVADAPLVSMNQIMDLIYRDLDEAIDLFTKSGNKRASIWQPNIDIARGVYARAAMLKNDWAKARDMARAARKDYPIMTGEQYTDGFYLPNKEWMWANAADQDVTGYAGWGAFFGCNGAYVGFWGYGAGQISYDLYRMTDPNDVRRKLYFTPDKTLKKPMTPAAFWNKEVIDPLSMNLNKAPAMVSSLNKQAQDCYPSAGETYAMPKAYSQDGSEGQSTDLMIPFGAQYKFWGMGKYTTISTPYMRAAELALYEAEACYRLGDIAGAQSALTEINSQRIPGYTCTKTGDDFWQEYMLTSRIELWGEGQAFFNMKRWNVTAVRNVWVEEDMTSNNIPAQFGYTNGPDVQNGWRWSMPRSETRQNKLADPTLLDQSDMNYSGNVLDYM